MVIPTPELPSDVFFWSICGPPTRVISPGLPVTSQLLIRPAWKSPFVVSVKQPACAERVRLKLRAAEPPSGTSTSTFASGPYPAAAAAKVGYVPAGTVNWYSPLESVVVLRLPSDSVAPSIGSPLPFVTAPWRSPSPIGVHEG